MNTRTDAFVLAPGHVLVVPRRAKSGRICLIQCLL